MSVTIFSMNIFLLYPEASSRVDILRLLSLFLHHSCYCDIPEKKSVTPILFFYNTFGVARPELSEVESDSELDELDEVDDSLR